MKTYKVRMMQTQHFLVNIEADSYAQAKDIANFKLEQGDCTPDDYVEFEIYSIDEVTK